MAEATETTKTTETATTKELSPQIGETFPSFSLSDAAGNVHNLSDYSGQYVVLYSYPKNDTPGCTREACAFRDHTELQETGVVILGISPDDAKSHAEFAEKYNLPFPLLVDEGANFMRSIGAYGPKNMYGKVTEGVKRQTFIVGPDGTLLKSWRAVKVDGHADAVAKFIREARLKASQTQVHNKDGEDTV